MNGKLTTDSSDAREVINHHRPLADLRSGHHDLNEDGSQTTIYDYGTGCEEDQKGINILCMENIPSTYPHGLSRTVPSTSLLLCITSI